MGKMNKTPLDLEKQSGKVIEGSINAGRSKNAHKMDAGKESSFEVKYRQLFESMQEGILLIDVNSGEIIEINSALKNLLGYNSDDLNYIKIWDFNPFRDIYENEHSFDEFVNTGRILSGNVNLYTKTNTPCYFEIQSARYQVDERDVIQYIVQDKSKERQLEATLNASEMTYQSLMDNSNFGIASVDLEGNITLVNNTLCKMTGFTENEVLHKSFTSFLPPQEAAKNFEYFQNTVHNPDDKPQLELNILHKNGTQVYLIATPSIIWKEGKIVGFNALLQDITRLKEDEDALKASEEKYRGLVENSMVGIYQATLKGRLLNVNQAFASFFGYVTPTQMIERINDMTHQLYFDPGDRREWLQLLSLKGSAGPKEFSVTHRNGDQLWVLETARQVKDRNSAILYYEGMILDITERKRAEEALIDAESRYRALVEQLPLIAYTDSATKIGQTMYISPQLKNLLGYDPDEWINNKNLWLDIMHEDDRGSIEKAYKRTFRSGEKYDTEFRVYTRDGRLIWLHDEATLIRNKSGKPLFWQGILRDVTTRKEDEAALQESEEKYRSLFENVPVGVYRTSPEGKILAANPALVRMMGFDTEEELKNLSVMDLYFDQSVRKEYLNFYKGDEVQNVEICLKRKDGRQIIVLDSFRIINDRGKTYYEGTLTDITALKLAEGKLNLKVEEMMTLYETSQMVTTELELSKLLWTIVERAALLLRGNSGFLYLFDENRHDLKLVIETTGTLPLGVRLKIGEGLVGKIAQTLKPMIIDDYSQWEGRSSQNAAIDLKAVIEVPIIFSGQLIGVLGVEEIGSTTRKFSDDDMRLLSLFAAQAAGAIHNARLFEETRNRATQMSLLYDAGLALNSTLDEHEQLKFLFEIARDTLHAERAEFYRVDSENHRITFEVGVGYQPNILSQLSQISFLIGEEYGIVGWVANHRQSVNISNLKTDPRYIEKDSDLRSGLWVPVEHNNQMQGVLCMCSTQVGAFQPEHEQLLMLFANQAAVAMENTRLLKETQHHLSQLNALHEIDLAIAGSVDTRISLGVILNQTLQQLGMDAAAVLLLNPYTQILEYAAGVGFHSNVLQHTHIKLGEGFAGQAAIERELVLVHDLTAQETGFIRSPKFALEGFISYYAKPLIARGQVKGVLELFHRERHTPNQTWLDFLDAIASQSAIAIDSAELFNNLQMANTSLNLAYDNTLEGWGRALELRDQETEGHTRRAADLTLKLARILRVDETDLIHFYRGALLHDIGKMGVPDNIVLKPGPLSEEEWEIMRKHPQYAYDMLSPITFLKQAMDIPYYHHEKWDGSGYPHGLKGDLIPLSARIFAVVDVYDALTSDRPYRPAWTKEKALDYIQSNAGKHFDPEVVEAFFKLL